MRIEKLEASIHVKGRILLTLSDGTMLKVTEQEVVAFRLKAPMELDEETGKKLEESAHRSQARETAAQMVGRRPYSRKECKDKLLSKGISEEIAEETLDWLTEIGALDESSYASMLVRHYSAMGYGEARLKEELFRKGIERQYWEDALKERPEAKDLIHAFLEKKWHGVMPEDEAVKKMIGALQRRGFSWSDIREGIKEYSEKWEEIDT